MDDNLIRRRKEKLSPKAQGLLDDINGTGAPGAEVGGSEFEDLLSRLSELSAGEQPEVIALLEAQGFGLMRRAEEAQEVAEMTEGA